MSIPPVTGSGALPALARLLPGTAGRPEQRTHRPLPTDALVVGVLVVVMVLAALVGAAPTASAATTSRAMWVWTVPNQPGDVVTLATAHGINTLFVAAPARLPTSAELPAIAELVTQARAAGLQVDVLGGDPTWVDNPTWVVDNWLTPALSTGLFSGVHADIEPWTTPAWASRQGAVVRKYLTTLDQLRVAAGSHPVAVDLPFWAHQVAAGNRSTLSREALKRSSAASVMAYRNTAEGEDGTLAVAAGVLADGVALGKPIRVGQETNDVGSDPSETKQTFYGMTETQMAEQLALVDAGASAYSSYAGLAIHDYTGYAAMGAATVTAMSTDPTATSAGQLPKPRRVIAPHSRRPWA